jgi:hypothetical protein
MIFTHAITRRHTTIRVLRADAVGYVEIKALFEMAAVRLCLRKSRLTYRHVSGNTGSTIETKNTNSNNNFGCRAGLEHVSGAESNKDLPYVS